MALDITKKYTENPFLDNLIYYVQQIAYSCILKDSIIAITIEGINRHQPSPHKGDIFF